MAFDPYRPNAALIPVQLRFVNMPREPALNLGSAMTVLAEAARQEWRCGVAAVGTIPRWSVLRPCQVRRPSPIRASSNATG
ncbi:hypothetical protein OCOJLMKI_5188 [Methylobacterium iners]|uniref:Uncharacterized protein n=1 Tax=Methylobacterium iners TaxID=418707 RepID=A0ABQ4S7V4_9HYPH|nr:hypothetical protein OCOJLMKI_5188 [Methylobacterium iners]